LKEIAMDSLTQTPPVRKTKKVNRPKYQSGYEFIVSSSTFGLTWAEKEFGQGYRSFFPIGKVGKSMKPRNQKRMYEVSFTHNKAQVIWDEEKIDTFKSVASLGAEVEHHKSYVVLCVSHGHGGQGVDQSSVEDTEPMMGQIPSEMVPTVPSIILESLDGHEMPNEADLDANATKSWCFSCLF
jgi:hypothetical protein